jgi:hypothetical protein
MSEIVATPTAREPTIIYHGQPALAPVTVSDACTPLANC